MSPILRFPGVGAQPPEMGASWWRVLQGRIGGWFCRLLNALRVPGAVRDADIQDELTGQHITIHVGTRFTRISVNGRDYYFRRLSGRFDGTGTGCC